MENQESPWWREQGKGSSCPFSSTFKKRSNQRGKLFNTHEDFAVISPHYIFFGISICQKEISFEREKEEKTNTDRTEVSMETK
jgi:hypothetical protein